MSVGEPENIREAQAPLKVRYRDDPASARVTFRARGDLDSPAIACRVETGRGMVESGLHPATGGDGLLACSGDMLLEALVACAGVTLRAVAAAIGIDVRGGTVQAEGDLDVRGTLGVDREVPVGFTAIRVRFELDADTTDEQRATLRKLVDRYCVVSQSLRAPVAFDVELQADGIKAVRPHPSGR